ncbi:hypothetical protein VNI00_000761 [Paramarasmius palmivorus]|uniref:HNH nuclease domain-containing protein n=1 Tax=Paramarasmius palmivorus TaxID=297713 RepID=A0AAW0E5Z5_9AGAR
MHVVSDEEISSIDDPRNCLLIDESLHILFGLKCGSEPNTSPICSFLRIPNNFMKREHSCVHPTDESQNSHLLERDTRVHFHAFDKKYLDSVSISAMLEVGALYDNKIVRLPPQDTPNAVPSFLWDMHYGCTALACWAERTEEFSAFSAMVKEYYESACEAYLDEDDENEDDSYDDDHMDIKGKRRATDPEDNEEAENSPRKRTRTEPARELDAFDIVGALWMMSAAVQQKRENDDRVSSWRKEVP